jgi:hypothetical protein
MKIFKHCHQLPTLQTRVQIMTNQAYNIAHSSLLSSKNFNNQSMALRQVLFMQLPLILRSLSALGTYKLIGRQFTTCLINISRLLCWDSNK